MATLTKIIARSIDDAGTTSRLREMLQVLRRREVMRGMTPEKLRQILEDLGPTYVKLGQVLSMRPDFLPPEYCEELAKLQSAAKPLPFEVIQDVVEGARYASPSRGRRWARPALRRYTARCWPRGRKSSSRSSGQAFTMS